MCHCVQKWRRGRRLRTGEEFHEVQETDLCRLLRLEELGIDCRSGLYGPEHDFRLAVCLILTCAVHKPYNHHRQHYADSNR